MENKHTPGPWYFVTPENDEDQVLDDLSEDEICIAGKDQQGTQWYIAHVLCGLDQTEANAKLIAAAPELLDSLRRLLSHAEQAYKTLYETKIPDNILEFREEIKNARQAIDNATK